MNTLLFTLEYPPFHGGVANYYANLVKRWPDAIFVLDNNDGQLVKAHWPALKWLKAIGELKRSVEKNKIDQVIVGQILPLGLPALIGRHLFGIKYSVILHGLDFSLATKSWRKKLISKLILAKAEKIICANTYTAELTRIFLDHRADGQIAVVNPGAEKNYELEITNYPLPPRLRRTSELLKNNYNLNNKIILLSVGRLIKRKGFDKVIEAMPKILEKVPNLHYVIVGSGAESENLKCQISNLKLEKNVLIIDNASDQTRDDWYNTCDIFIMTPSNLDGDYEGFGIVYLEANLAGKPVIASPSGGVGDAVVNGLNGLVVNPDNANEISQAITGLAQNKNLRDKLGEQGRERAGKEFSWEKQAEKIYNAIM